MQRLTPREVQRLLEASEAKRLLLDVREPWEFAICQIEGSVNIPMGQIPQALNGLESTREIVVICHHGIRSLQVARFLEHSGFTRVINLEGGIDAWSRQLDSTVSLY